MLGRAAGVIFGGTGFAAGAYMLIRQFTDATGTQGFAIGMGITLLIGGGAALIVNLSPRR